MIDPKRIASEQWQEIATAPKDGSAIRVALSCGTEATAEYWEAPPVEIDPREEWGGWAIAFDTGLPLNDDYGFPTHWMPLPEAPGAHP